MTSRPKKASPKSASPKSGGPKRAAARRAGPKAARSAPGDTAAPAAPSRAVLEALVGHQSPFVRTPKFAGQAHGSVDPAGGARLPISRLIPKGLVESALGILLLAGAALAVSSQQTLVSTPFLLLFSIGYLWVGLGTLRDRFLRAG